MNIIPILAGNALLLNYNSTYKLEIISWASIGHTILIMPLLSSVFRNYNLCPK